MNWNNVEPPEGWARSTLGEAAQLVTEKVDPSAVPNARYIGLEHVEAHSMRILGSGRGSDVKSAKTRFSTGDVLYGKLRPYLNKVARPDFDGISSTDFLVFTESDQVGTAYLAHYLNQLWIADRAHHLSAGVELPRVDWKSLAQLPIVYPPSKSAQRGIVRQVETAKSLSASAASHLDAAARAIDRFRRAVVAAACTGHLTADWREANSESAGPVKALLDDVDALRNRAYCPPHERWDFNIPDSWALVSLDRVTSLITSGSRGWAKYYAKDGPLFIRAQNINSDWLDLTDIAHVRPPRGSEGERTKVRQGDMLVTITGANVTKSAFVDRAIGDAYVSQHVALARPVLPELIGYLHLWIVSPEHGRKKLASDAYGAGKPGLNLENLRTTPIGLPPLEEQREIVRRTSAMFDLADGVMVRLDAASRRVDRSSQAVLAKAFRGELSLMETDK